MSWAYLIIYFLLLFPTYVLPYLGSNSSLVNAVSAGVGMGLTPQWWAHVWFLVMLVILCWRRGQLTGKRILPVFPVLAGVFDMVPVLSFIPLVPTVMHLIAMVMGSTAGGQSDTQAVGNVGRKTAVAMAVATAVAILGCAMYMVNVSRMGKEKVFPPAKATVKQLGAPVAVEKPQSGKEVAAPPLLTQPQDKSGVEKPMEAQKQVEGERQVLDESKKPEAKQVITQEKKASRSTPTNRPRNVSESKKVDKDKGKESIRYISIR